ncbi:hypothetical protein ACLOJK_016752 [Asimina triloba]
MQPGICHLPQLTSASATSRRLDVQMKEQHITELGCASLAEKTTASVEQGDYQERESIGADCGIAQIGTVVAEPEEDEREVGAQQPHLHRREYGLGNGMYFFVIAAAAVTCSKPLPQTVETLQLRHLQRKQAVCRNVGLKTKRRFPRNSSIESVTQNLLLSLNTHLSEPHLFVVKAEREECILERVVSVILADWAGRLFAPVMALSSTGLARNGEPKVLSYAHAVAKPADNPSFVMPMRFPVDINGEL